MQLINEKYFQLKKIDDKNIHSIQNKINSKTKPLGSLGKLETLATKLALILGSEKIPEIKPTLLIFAADHGISGNGVSIAPPEVTQQMVFNFLQGGAAINCFCRVSNIPLQVINAGINSPINHPQILNQPSGNGTQDFTKSEAMTEAQLNHALLAGIEITNSKVNEGNNVIGFGEMGIGNTSSAAAIMAAVLKTPADECVGRGTGIDDTTFNRKLKLIEIALQRHQSQMNSPFDILRCVGGFEIAQMVGAMLQTAQQHKVILVDGFISTAAALVASQINSHVIDFMVFCHESEEQGHKRMLNYLGSKSLLNLNMRLGEGTGAALAVPLIFAAKEFYNNMASFSEAQVENVVIK
ncbi:MAG: nicotinate-nucleotide--dimethylbenzimidazole phosphoribosyltransferase [Gammaproteobacteria bacterium]|nr:nicotinate-nucleotide--dimethylbenzimidazole phosphoribosyltransferase [Gammaproteobacteria bacterium]